MPELVQHPADSEHDWERVFEPGRRLLVRERFVGAPAGQRLEVVDVADEPAPEGDWPAWVALRPVDAESPTARPRAQPQASSDVRQAIEDGRVVVR